MLKKFSVNGMTCSACSSGIEKNLNKIDGVNGVSVSLLSKEMTVDFDDNKISSDQIIFFVKKLGYVAEEFGSKKTNKYSDAKKLKIRFCVSIFILIPLLYLCMANMLGLPKFIDNRINHTLSFILTLIILIINKDFFINGLKAVIRRSPNMDTLVSLGSASAFIYSTVITILTYLNVNFNSHNFFDSSAMVVTLVTLGKWLEELSKIKTGDAVEKLGKLLPATVNIIVDGEEKTVLTSQVKENNIIVFKAGDFVAVDGYVIEGRANIDKSAITGESLPEEVLVGDKIISGSILKNGYIFVKAKKVGGETLFNQVLEIVKQAGTSKAPVQKLADKISSIFVPVVTVISVFTFIIWMILTGDLYSSFNFAISVLVVSCPCSLGLATPVAIMAATGYAARNGILFKNAEALQSACKINCVLLDKTATITEGELSVEDVVFFTGTSSEYFPIISALEAKSNHPLAESILNYCGASSLVVDDYEYVFGKGIIGEIYGLKYFIGNEKIIPNYLEIPSFEYKFNGQTIIYFASEIEVICAFSISDKIKIDSRQAIVELQKLNLRTVMITGDNRFVAEKIAKQVNIDEVQSEVLPQEKFEIVKKYKNQGFFVAMVGDGINDSPAIKCADVGIAIGTGTDIAIDSSSVIIVNGSLTGIKKAIEISSRAFKIIKQNLFWAFFYNLIGLPIAAGALSFLGIILTPAIAATMMSCSSLFVVSNALRILRKDKKTIANKNNTISLEIKIAGMTCMHCVSKVKEAILALDGVISVNVSLKENTATLLMLDSVAVSDVESAIVKSGFTIVK